MPSVFGVITLVGWESFTV